MYDKMKFKSRRYYLYYMARVMIFFIQLLPSRIGLFVAKKAALLAYWGLPSYTKITIENLKAALAGERTERELQAISRRVFENLGKNALEMVHLKRLNVDTIDGIVQMQNREILDNALEKGKGVIIVTAHFGNWELMPAALRIKGYSGAVIGRRIYFDRYDRFLNRLRAVHDVSVIYRDESPRKALKVLKANGVLGIVADQDVNSVDGVFVNFFGQKAYTPVGPVALALASGAPLVPAFMLRDDGLHRLIFEKPIDLSDTGDKEKDMTGNTQRWSDVVESYIRRYPEQWVWMHRRWKTKEN